MAQVQGLPEPRKKILNIAHADNRLGKYMIVPQGKSWISIRGDM